MRYMLFCCIDEEHWDGLSPQERDGVMADYGAWIDRLEASGRHVMSARLQPVTSAATVRRNGDALAGFDLAHVVAQVVLQLADAR